MSEFNTWFKRVKCNLGFHSSWQNYEFKKQMEKAFERGRRTGRLKERQKREER